MSAPDRWSSGGAAEDLGTNVTFGEQFPGSGFGPASGAARRCQSSSNDFGPRIWLKGAPVSGCNISSERQGGDPVMKQFSEGNLVGKNLRCSSGRVRQNSPSI